MISENIFVGTGKILVKKVAASCNIKWGTDFKTDFCQGKA
jgi:hypothetical protein